jgi:hypothetical protein
MLIANIMANKAVYLRALQVKVLDGTQNILIRSVSENVTALFHERL